MTRTAEIETRLREAFEPTDLQVIDDSESHRGHAGFQEGGESHFHVVMRAPAFEGQSRIARHRAVHKAIGPDLMGAIHALSLDLGT
ncbi:BolA family transcriptional regulator [Roseivivax halodurans JCM 10272]|uniref:BolA family transcriptional regulator n=1 Tax=Roseivivax halodurans JCM 10272 TaxID=1449350 RepID=X7EHN1_9RHOB|nr:BolA family protein [Roseivivax halodurans]ETX15614.1 BolA family transcriptional regulator [Roseivivax halodurans JCM 10272]